MTSEPSSPRLKAIGMLFTAVWLSIGALYMWNNHAEVVCLKPNEICDAIAGFLSPLAVLWLVVAYWTQAEELRLQVKELGIQVESTRKLADTTSRQLELNFSEIQPVFIYAGGSGQPGNCSSIQIAVKKNDAFDVRIGEMPGPFLVSFRRRDAVAVGSSINLQVDRCEPGWFQLLYTDTSHSAHFAWVFYPGRNRVYVRQADQPMLDGRDLEDWLDGRV